MLTGNAASATVGNVVAGIGNLYIIYMLYFDFMRDIKLPSYRQLSWSLLHFPFHLAMNIFVQGSSQFVVWWKIMEILRTVNEKFVALVNKGDDPNFNPPNITEWFASEINRTAFDIYALYPPKYYDTWADTSTAVDDLLEIPLDWWYEDHPENVTDPIGERIYSDIGTVYYTIQNSLFATFKINGLENVKNQTLDAADFEIAANDANWNRYYLVVSCTTNVSFVHQVRHS